jgi:chromate transporter
MRDEVVSRRRWLADQEFLDLVGATNLIPGPNSTEMAIHVGYRRAGRAGLVAAGAAFIVPAVLIVTALAAVYTRHGATPQAAWLMYGVKPVIMAVVFQALWTLTRTAVKDLLTGAAGAVALVLYFAGTNEIALLIGAGVGVMAIQNVRRMRLAATVGALAGGSAGLARSSTCAGAVAAGVGDTTGKGAAIWARTGIGTEAAVGPGASGAGIAAAGTEAVKGTGAGMGTGAAAAGKGAATGTGATAAAVLTVPFSLSRLFLIFLKIGSVLYGSGYVLLAFLRADFVQRLGWLTEGQLLDAVAIGQFTPGPVFTAATFIGYLLGGLPGAAAATAGIFLPAFFFVAASHPLIPQLRRSPWAGALLDGVNAASLALMAGVSWQLGRAAVVDTVTGALAVAALLALLRFRVNSAWLVAAGAAVGFVARMPAMR